MALGVSVEEVAAATDIDTVKIELLERCSRRTLVSTVLKVQEFFEGRGVRFVYGDGYDVSFLKMPDGKRVYVDGSDQEPEVRHQVAAARPQPKPTSRPMGFPDPWEDRIVRTSWGYWIRPRKGD
jgi:hypothetical protein